MSILTNMKVGKRLLLGFTAVLILLVIGTAVGIWGISNMNKRMDDAIEEGRKMAMAGDMKAAIEEILFNIPQVIIAPEKAAKQENLDRIKILREKYKKDLEELKTSAKTEEGKQLLAGIEDSIVRARESDNKMLDLGMAGNTKEALALFSEKGGQNFASMMATLDKYVEWRQKSINDLATATESLRKTLISLMVVFGALAIGLAAVIGVITSRSITKPIETASAHLDEIAKGDFSIAISENALARQDELGKIARSMHNLNQSVGRMIKDVSQGVTTLASASTELSAISSQMTDGVGRTSMQANSVSTAAEEMSTNVVSVAAGMEQATASLTMVATATEEMTSTIAEIAGNSEKARSTTNEAVAHATRVSDMISKLGQAAQEIGKVTETITSISAQTNLLALNATIEAARAGAAGKGFAVVAGEIKELAQQTSGATEDIKNKIAAIQSSTAETIGDIEAITKVISEVSEIVTTIAGAIEEQSVVTKDIARNIAQATMGVKDANDRVAQSSSVTKDIAREISGVNQAASDMTNASSQVQSSAAELSQLAEQLREMVGKFKV
ncbi:MAG: methyl-accepting chemotaxis protein [Desulfomonilia bacterium]